MADANGDGQSSGGRPARTGRSALAALVYWSLVLGKLPSVALVRQMMIAAAMTVPGVASAQVFFTGFSNRKLSGQVQITSTAGVTIAVGF